MRLIQTTPLAARPEDEATGGSRQCVACAPMRSRPARVAGPAGDAVALDFSTVSPPPFAHTAFFGAPMPELSIAPGLLETRSVDVTESQSIAYWLDALGVDEHHLRTAVAEVGTSAQDVRCYLGMP